MYGGAISAVVAANLEGTIVVDKCFFDCNFAASGGAMYIEQQFYAEGCIYDILHVFME